MSEVPSLLGGGIRDRNPRHDRAFRLRSGVCANVFLRFAILVAAYRPCLPPPLRPAPARRAREHHAIVMALANAPPAVAPTNRADGIIETDVPARLDRLPWGRFHTLLVAALGITWIFDGLEVTLAGTLAGALKASPVLHFSNTDVGLTASAYLAGAVLGALLFGWLTDRLGRKKLFFITL